MKKSLLTALLLGTVCLWPVMALAWGNWSGRDKASWRAGENRSKNKKNNNKPDKWGKKESGKKYCSMSQEKGLLKLLRQLNQPFSDIKSMRGGLSEARWKYNMIMKLRKYDDSASDQNQVWWGITLARYLKRTSFMQQIYNIAFARKGRIDYTNKPEIDSIQTAARNYFRALQPESLPYIKRLTGSKPAFTYCSSAAKGCKTSLMINRYLDDLAANADGYAVTKSIGRTSGANGEGTDSREIRAILITRNASWRDDHGNPTVIITGAIHGNEWATPEVCLGIAEYLLENKDNSSPATDNMGALINKEAVKAAAGSKPKTPIVPRLTNIQDLLNTIQVSNGNGKRGLSRLYPDCG